MLIRPRIYFTFYKMHNMLCNRLAGLCCDNVVLFTAGFDGRRGCFVNLLCSYPGVVAGLSADFEKMIMLLSFKVS